MWLEGARGSPPTVFGGRIWNGRPPRAPSIRIFPVNTFAIGGRPPVAIVFRFDYITIAFAIGGRLRRPPIAKGAFGAQGGGPWPSGPPLPTPLVTTVGTYEALAT